MASVVIEQVPLWERLREIQKHPVVQSMYAWLFIVPILAKLLLAVGGPHFRVVVFGHEYTATLALPFSWRAFYFAAFAFVLGNIVFAIRCPAIIKDHWYFAHFRDQGKSVEQLHGYVRDLRWRMSKASFSSVDSFFQTYKDRDEKAFWHVHESANSAATGSRAMCVGAYLVGFLALSWVMFDSLRWVIRAIVE